MKLYQSVHFNLHVGVLFFYNRHAVFQVVIAFPQIKVSDCFSSLISDVSAAGLGTSDLVDLKVLCIGVSGI